MPTENDNWFFRAPDGAENGPLDSKGLRERVVAGDILAETPVRRGDGDFRPAVEVQECGFDCLVLQTKPSLDVLGPFAREYLDRPEITGSLPGDGLFFVRSGTVADAASVPGSAGGTTGAALVERILEAERALRAAEKRRREAEAALKAKDLEFEAERAKFAAEVSALKADVLRRESEAEGLRADAAACEDRERAALEIQAKLVDAEKESASLGGKLRKAAETESALRNELSEAVKAAAAADARAAEADARAKEADRRAERAMAGVAWFRETLAKTVSEAESRFGADADDAGKDGGAPPAETVVPEIVEDAGDDAARKIATRGNSPARGPERTAGARTSQMAALESQLRKELRMAGAAGGPSKLGSFFKSGK